MMAACGRNAVTLSTIAGTDHAVILVRSLDQAAATWQRLGFTLAPRGTHSAHLGTGNHTIMLDPDYIELMGVLTPTGHNAPSRAFLATRGDGIERMALTTTDAAAGTAAARARGGATGEPLHFERPVDLPGGRTGAAKFSIFEWPPTEAPAGLRLFACQHHTRDTVWLPHLMKHANGARHLRQVLVVAPDPAAEAALLAKMIDSEVRAAAPDTAEVPTGNGRAPFVFATRAALAARFPGVPLDGLPERGGAGLVIATDNIDRASLALGGAAIACGRQLCVPPAGASGTLLVFES
jgi:hypothetical protein